MQGQIEAIKASGHQQLKNHSPFVSGCGKYDKKLRQLEPKSALLQ